MDTKGGKLRLGGDGGVLNWAVGIDMYTVMCIKLMTDLKKCTDIKILIITSYFLNVLFPSCIFEPSIGIIFIVLINTPLVLLSLGERTWL